MLRGFFQLCFDCLLLCGPDSLPRFIQLHRIKIQCLRFQISVLRQRLIQLGRVSLLLRLQLFQSSLHGGNILAEFLCACILRILKFLKKKRLFGTQFL